MSIKEWVSAQRADMLETAMELIRIRSVSEPGTSEHPYGEGCARILDKALAMGKEMGFAVENHGYHCGSILLPGRTDREIGIFVHLDVVHEGTGWSTDPYTPMVRDGWLYGRGSADDKGPAAAVLYSMKYLKQHGIQLEHTIRLYLGCSEERGMEDIGYYTSHYPAPDFSFTPDASFPVCYGEKGILEGEFSCPIPKGHMKSQIVEFTAGVASNAVPATARVVLDHVSYAGVKSYVRGLDSSGDFSVERGGKQEAAAQEKEVQEAAAQETDHSEGCVIIEASGKSAHAAFPEGSDSAAVKLARMLSEAPFLEEEEKDAFRFMDRGFADYYGEGMGISFEDKLSGRLTLVGGMARTEQGRFVQNFNIRYSVTADVERMAEQLSRTAGEYGWILDWIRDDPPCVISPDRPEVEELTAICQRVLGTEVEAYSMGGGTYARKLPNAVAFGPGIRGQKKPCPPGHGGGHQPDECVKIENLTNAMEIYIESILRLDEIIC